MAKQSKTLLLTALKLGLSDEEKVLSKAAEFERRLQMKSTINNITDTAKAVICLDLAATVYKVDLDLKSAIKCSGLKSPSYTNSRKIVENILELNTDKVTVSGLCLTLQCDVQDLSKKILEEYRLNSKMELDMSLPQYSCMAVYQACRISKLKVSKSKLIEKAQLKPAQWAKLDAEWAKFTDAKFSVAVKKKRGRPAKNPAIDMEEPMEVDNEISKKENNIEPETEPYEEWKHRILEAAYEELKTLNTDKQSHTFNEQVNKQKDNQSKPNQSLDLQDDVKIKENKQLLISFSPRRSPRKTPQKFEPYKSPVKDKGVRLLFPL